MKNLVSAAVAFALLAAPAMAGDWTGTYLGAQVGKTDIKTSGGVTGGDGTTYGLHGGYDYDFGDWVVGGEIDWDKTDIGVAGGAAVVDDIGRLKFKGGYDFGPALGYVVVGGAQANSSLGNESGFVYGLGIAGLVSDQFSISGEFLLHDFNNVAATGVDADVRTFNLRASFRF